MRNAFVLSKVYGGLIGDIHCAFIKSVEQHLVEIGVFEGRRFGILGDGGDVHQNAVWRPGRTSGEDLVLQKFVTPIHKKCICIVNSYCSELRSHEIATILMQF